MGYTFRPPLAAVLFLALFLSVLPTGLRAQPGEPPAYLALGDSIAFGAGVPEPQGGGYVSLVHDALRNSRRYRESGLDLVNLAVPGATSDSLLAPGGQADMAVAELRERQGKVEIISINIGGNDLLLLARPDSPCVRGEVAGEECLARFGQTLSGVQRNLAGTLGRLRAEAGGARIFVLDLYNPLSGTGDVREPVADVAVQQLNGVIGAVAAAEGLGAQFVSVHPYFQGRGLQWIAQDGLHPNENGHRVIAELLLAAIDGRQPQIPAELLEATPVPIVRPGQPQAELGGGGSGTVLLLAIAVPLAFAAGVLAAGAYFVARGRR
jgi:lysophospholipase L1-like esterase